MDDGLVLVYVNPNKEDNCVLILVVVDDGLVLNKSNGIIMTLGVLILVVVDDGLVLTTLSPTAKMHKVS